MRACAPEDTSRQICELVRKFGLPEGIFSAQQHGYILQLNKILKMALKIKRNLVVEYSPQTDGFLEDSKAFVRRLLSLVLAANPADWDQHLHEVFFLQSGPSDYEEEEDLSSLEVELQEASSAPDENRPPSFCGPEALKSCPDGERDTPGKARRHEDVCSLPDEGSRDVFAVLQCDRCQAWAHDLCVTRQHGWAYQKTSVRCRACLLADEGAGPGPGPFSRALEVEESRTSRTVGPTWPATGTTGSKHSSSSK
ncbi:uncharacterized protein LOC110197113 [Phascolarctos cinereus]|uniref:Uncharacterized protein LOC110197113 n=1 Tax=Phascolarctos cinereus TaxID=38626 RepID=A0A6P5J593_PHACI|nr:uncharacterized protein LOC110197113 [Phascolarctos cinereus]